MPQGCRKKRSAYFYNHEMTTIISVGSVLTFQIKHINHTNTPNPTAVSEIKFTLQGSN